MACGTCLAVHHPDCWSFNEGCSIFGCGGREARPLRELATQLPGGALVLDEGTRPPIRLAPIVEGLVRKLRTRARFLPRTVPAGVLGAGFGVGVGLYLGVDFLRKPHVFWGLVGSGLAYGLLAPFAAPLQLQRPRSLAVVSSLAFCGLFMALDWARIRGVPGGIGLAVIFSLLLLAATSVGEAVAGRRTRIAEFLQSWSVPLRMLVTWASFVLGFCVLAYLDVERWPEWRIITDILAVSGLATAAGGTAMETGKQAFLRAVEGPALLPPGDPAEGGRRT